MSDMPTHDLCIPALNALSNISKRLATVYLQPSSAIFHGSYSIVLVDLSQTHDKVWDDNWSNTSGSSGQFAGLFVWQNLILSFSIVLLIVISLLFIFKDSDTIFPLQWATC